MTKRYTIKELSEVLSISVQATNKKVSKLGLETTKELINNRLTTIVLLSDIELNDVILSSGGYQSNKPVAKAVDKEVSQVEQSEFNNQKENQFKSSIQPIKQVEQPSDKLIEMLAEYAGKAGKFDLLEDKSKDLKNDIKYWQDLYFTKENEIKELIRETEAQKIKINNLETAITKEQKRPFWQRNIL